MATSSADPDALDDFVSTSRDLNAELAPRVTALEHAFEAFLGQPSDVGVGSPSQSGASPPRFEHFGDTIVSAGAHRRDRDLEADWIEVVSRAFREAGSGGTLRSADDAVIDERLAAAGVAGGPPTLISAEAPSAAGLTVDSGFKDDPVNCGTGSFIEPEADLPAPARLWAMTWMRNHNSRFPHPGPLGRGWSSWATTRLDLTAGGARFEGPDGQVAELARTEGGFSLEANLAAEVSETESGAELSWWSGERWLFGPDAKPTEIVLGPAGSVRFHHDEHGRLRAMVHDAGRRLDVEWAGERIVAVRASDARGRTYGTVTYEYANGNLVASHAPAGRRTYKLDEHGRVVAVVDADGVELARNTYDADGRVLEQRSPRGLCTTYDYRPGPVTTVRDGEAGPKVVMFHDAGGRLTGVVDDHGGRLTRRFDQAGNLTSVRDRTGAVTSQEFGPHRRLARRILPGGAEERYTYDQQGRLTSCQMAGGAPTTLEYGSDADTVPCRITDPEGGATVIEAHGGLVRRLTDADGVTVSFDHDGEGFAVKVTDGLSNDTLLERDQGARITAVRLPGGETQRFEHDHAGRLLRRTDADGAVWEATWSPGGRLTGCTNPDGSRFQWRHDHTGEVNALVDPLGAVTTMERDVLGNVVRLGGADGAKFDLSYDGLSRLIAVHDPAGGSTHYEHDANGRVVTVMNALGHGRRVDYDERGNVVRAVDAEGRQVTVAYDQAGRVMGRTLPDGGTELIERDRCGRPVAFTDAGGNTTRYEYTPAGRLHAVVSPLGNAAQWHYDAAGRVVAHTAPTGAVTRYRRDVNGWVAGIVRPDGEVTRLQRDPCGRVVERQHPDGGTDRFGYDALGRLVEVTDPTGCRRRRRYDDRGLLVEAVDPAGGVTRYHHDVRGLLASMTDAAGGTVHYQRDPVGRMTAGTDALGRVTRIHHDQAGRPRLLVDPDGRRCELRFDRASSLVGLRAGGFEATFERDALGRLTRVLDHTGDHRFELDAGGRLIARHGPAGTLRWRYDADGRPSALVHPDGAEELYERDAGGRLLALTHPVAGRVELTRDNVGRLVGFRAPGVDRAWDWRHNRLVGYREGLRHVELGRDEGGRVTEVRRREEVTRYGYDEAGRLTTTNDTTWHYDTAGRLSGEDGPAGSVRYGYDSSHRLVTAEHDGSMTQLSYDGAGRRLAESGGGRSRRYRWDPFGRLAGVDGTELSVNVLGELVAVNGEAVAWDPVGAVPQLRRIGDRSVVGAGEAWAVVADGQARWLSRDWDASPIGAVGDPWGRATSPGTVPEPGFRGEWMLEGLLWLRHRAYDPETRSFLSPDPEAGVPGFTTVADPYHYCHHNPVGWVDPLGQRPLTDDEWDDWKASHPTLAQMVTAPARAVADAVGQHWEILAAIAVVGAGVALVVTGANPVMGAGILIGAGSNLVVQVMKGGPIDSRNIALAGVVGGVSGGLGSAAGTAASNAATVAASPYAAAIPQVVSSTTGAFSNGVLTETVSERLDRNPLNDDVSTKDILVETGAGLVFGGVRSTVPHTNDVLDLRLPDRTLKGTGHISDAGKSLWSDSVLATHGDGATWPTTVPGP
jgi:RHS repeat-associated protein